MKKNFFKRLWKTEKIIFQKHLWKTCLKTTRKTTKPKMRSTRTTPSGSRELLLIIKQTEVPSGRLMSLPEFDTEFETMNEEIRCRVEYLNTFKQAFK